MNSHSHPETRKVAGGALPAEFEGTASQTGPSSCAQKTQPSPVLDGIIRTGLLLAAAVVAFAALMGFARSPRPTMPGRGGVPKPPSTVSPDKRQMVLVPGRPYRLPPEAGVPQSIVLAQFYIDRYETTNAAYSEFCRRTGHRLPFPPEDGYIRENPRHPVWNISARDAKAYCAFLGKRLPKDVEWLVAAGGVAAYPYPWGYEPAPGRANVGSGSLLAVGSSPGDISPFGVEDMAGNLPEYVLMDDGGYAVRGGAYYLPQDLARLTLRFSFPGEIDASRGYLRIGFRCVCEAGAPDADAVRAPLEPQ